MSEGLRKICESAGVPYEFGIALEIEGALTSFRRIDSTGQHHGYRTQGILEIIREEYDRNPDRSAARECPTDRTEYCETYVDETEQVLLTKSRTIRTVEDALKRAEVDLTVWRVERYTVNSWEMGYRDGEGGAKSHPLWQVKIWLKRIAPQSLIDVAESLAERATKHAPEYKPIPRQFPADPHMLELCLFDFHFGKYAWMRESGENFDLHIAEELFANAVADLLEKAAGFSVEKIVFPVGNDFLHIDNLVNTTFAGTVQDADGRLAKVVETAQVAVVKTIDKLRLIAPVSIITVPGNHDRTSLWHTAQFLRAWYRNCDNVSVDAEPMERKYLSYGKTLIGYTHGDEEKHDRLPIIMATEKPQEWAATSWHEWHIGHLHKKRETQYVGVDDHDGVIVRILPTLTARDKWHYQRGYHSTKLAEANLYSRERGLSGYVCTHGGGTNEE